MLSITRLLWVSGHINVSNPTLTPRSRFFHTLLLSLQLLQRATFRWQPSADDRSHPSRCQPNAGCSTATVSYLTRGAEQYVSLETETGAMLRRALVYLHASAAVTLGH